MIGSARKVNLTPDAIYNQEKNNFVDLNTDGSEIVKYFGCKTVFLTGATGFLGKILVEKLLRSCEDLETVFVLCREKKGKDVHTRVDEIYNDVIFSRLSQIQPKFRHKITPIRGDVSLPGLGISPEDRKLITSKTQVIFHVAATVRFDERMRLAVAINVKGTKEMLQLGKECQHLESFVHVSTAFSNCHLSTIEEKFYPPPFDTDDLIDIVDKKTDEELETLTPSLLGAWPNTYAFTKAVAENTVQKYSGNLPLCVFRPSIVISTYKEPIRGWIDNVYGPTGVITGAGVGVLKTLHCNGANAAEVVPVDLVVNAMIASAYKNYIEKREEIPIYNFVSAPENPISWDEYTNMNARYGIHIPTIQAIWYYSLTLNKYKPVHMLYALFLHYLPAFLIDVSCLLIGKQAQFVKTYKKIHKFGTVISYFANRRWKFTNNRVRDLWQSLSTIDKNAFPFDMSSIDWDYHSQMNTIGIRMYILKEDLSTLPAAKKKWQRLYILHNTLKAVFVFVALRLAYGVLTSLIA